MSSATPTPVTDADHAARIAREEEYWTAPRLFAFGFSSLLVAITLIYILSSI